MTASGRILAIVLLAGCASSSYRPATGTGKATARVSTYVHLSVDDTRVVRWRVVTVDNPTANEMMLECGALRFRIPPRMAADALLLPNDKGCDAHDATDFSPNDENTGIPIPDVTTIQGALRAAPK